MALVENAIATTGKEKGVFDQQTRENNLPTRVALSEERIKAVNRLMWVILVALITGMVATNIQLYMFHK